jgi:LEA14-like dessication related protein
MTGRHTESRALFALRAASLALCAVLFASCATGKIELRPVEAPPRARVEAKEAIALDRYRLRLPFALELENSGTGAVVLESFDCRLLVGGAEAGRIAGTEPESVAATSSTALPLEFALDLRDLGGSFAAPEGPTKAAFRIEAKLVLKAADGSRGEARAEAGGSFPIIREPRLSILSLKIERDILVTTKLRLAIEVHNPNAFPVSLGSISYCFDGEGKPWAEGYAEGPFSIGAGSSEKIALAFEMNFADRDRALLDLVANLRIVRYRLAGDASVAAGLEGLPSFPLRFDEEGSCRVER